MKDLLKRLIQAKSTLCSGELCAAEVIKDELAEKGIASEIEVWDENRANITFRAGAPSGKGGILFLCHLDVVPAGEVGWSVGPFEGLEKDGRIYGRGAADMKGGMAALLEAIKEVAGVSGEIFFAATAGEENDSCGIQRLISRFGDDLKDFRGVIIPEPTDFNVVTAHRGMLWLKVITDGKSAHASQPELGVNAINSMRYFLDELDKYSFDSGQHELLGRSTGKVTVISGGEAINIIPEQCEAGIDIRTVPGKEHKQIVSDLEEIIERLNNKRPEFAGKVEVVREVEALVTDANCRFVKEFCNVVGVSETKAVGFTTDGSHLGSLTVPVVVFGPGRPDVCHKPDEYIEIADLEKAAEIYKKIILHFAG